MNDASPFSKSSVLFAMTLIRPMFEKRGWDVQPYNDDEIAEALLRTHLHTTTQWLSPEHLSSAYTRLAPMQPRSCGTPPEDPAMAYPRATADTRPPTQVMAAAGTIEDAATRGSGSAHSPAPAGQTSRRS